MKLNNILNRFGLCTQSQFNELQAQVDSMEKQLKANDLGLDLFNDHLVELKEKVIAMESTDDFDIDLYKDEIENWIEDAIKNDDVLTESNFDIDDFWRPTDYQLLDSDDVADLIDEKLEQYEPEIDEPTIDTEPIIVAVAESLMGCLSRLTHEEPEPPAAEPEQPKEYVDHELMRILNDK